MRHKVDLFRVQLFFTNYFEHIVHTHYYCFTGLTCTRRAAYIFLQFRSGDKGDRYLRWRQGYLEKKKFIRCIVFTPRRNDKYPVIFLPAPLRAPPFHHHHHPSNVISPVNGLVSGASVCVYACVCVNACSCVCVCMRTRLLFYTTGHG